MIEIKGLKNREFKEFLTSDAYRKGEVIPISLHRALSHLKNPELRDDDTLLILAYNGEKLAGYLGVIPDNLPGGQSEKVHFGWLSCLWIDPLERGKGIAGKLLSHALMKWDNRLIMTEFTLPAKMLYIKSGSFETLTVLEGIRLYVKSDLQTILPPKKKIFKKLTRFFEVFDTLLNIVLDAGKGEPVWEHPEYSLEYPDTVDNEVEDLLSTGKGTFGRGKEELNWIINYPWILSPPEKYPDHRRYYFSSVEEKFRTVPVKIRNRKGELTGLMIFTIRNRSLKLPYFYFAGKAAEVGKILFFHIQKWNIRTFTTYRPELVHYLDKTSLRVLYKKKVLREYLVTPELKSQMDVEFLDIQDGDGDCAFT